MTKTSRIPRVSVIFEIEAAPKIVVAADSDADRLALATWVQTCRPDVSDFLDRIAAELHERKAA